MQILSIILSVFFLTLSVLPCTDAHSCDNDNEVESHLQHDHSEDEQDDCPPFCLCICCGITFTSQDLEVSCETAPIIQNQAYKPPYSFNYAFSFISSIWHPPSF